MTALNVATTPGFVVLSGTCGNLPSVVEFIHTDKAVASAERGRLARGDRSSRYVVRPRDLTKVS